MMFTPWIYSYFNNVWNYGVPAKIMKDLKEEEESFRLEEIIRILAKKFNMKTLKKPSEELQIVMKGLLKKGAISRRHIEVKKSKGISLAEHSQNFETNFCFAEESKTIWLFRLIFEFRKVN